MASYRQLKSGKWRAEVYRQGVRRSKSFATKTAARAWAARQEVEIEGVTGPASRMLFGDVMDRYAREVSAKKRGWRPEVIRIERIRRDKLSAVRICDLAPADLADWRDRRLAQVKGSTVKREMEQVSAILTRAQREWGLIASNPMTLVKRPSDGPGRDRRPTADEIAALGLSAGADLGHRTARTHHAWLFAIETAMRAGEIAGLDWTDIDLPGRVARLNMTKNGSPRDVPLSREAVRLLEALPRGLSPGVFGLTSAQITSLWAKIRRRAGVADLTFHDSRHEAITRLARRLDVLDLARMVGHRDIRQLMTYYNATAGEIAKRLD
jgi:integrase